MKRVINAIAIYWTCPVCNEKVKLIISQRLPIQFLNESQGLPKPLMPLSERNYPIDQLNIILKVFKDLLVEKFDSRTEQLYLVDKEKNVSRKILYARCMKCGIQFFVIYEIGIGEEDRPPIPNTIAILKIRKWGGTPFLSVV